MALLLYINGQRADLLPGDGIAQTKQVNDLNSLDNRQTSYTNKFNLPKTAANTRIMEFLTLTGNNSAIPYQKNACSLYSDTGECFVYNGWAVITDGGDTYEVVVYDGIIDLYKAIENTALSALDLSALNHDKSIAAIISSWDTSLQLPYRYILADYNGSTGATNASPPQVNIDYLVPSVNVAWLWNRLFEHFGMGYEGSVFATEAFTNLWMTYPKGISTADGDQEVLNIDSYLFNNTNGVRYHGYYFNTAETETFDANTLQGTPNVHIKVKQAATYRIEIEGTLNATYSPRVLLGKNCESYPDPFAAPYIYDFGLAIDGEAFAFSQEVTLNAGDSLCVMLRQRDRDRSFRFDGDCSAAIRLIKLNPNNFSFTTAFTDFAMRDFLQEVLQRFGLTMYKQKYTGHYKFLTLQEQLDQEGALNWSDKFISKTSENYIYGSYAQRNWFRYAYNDKESSYNDGYLEVPNVNLPDSKDILKSKIYSPERQATQYLGLQANVYKLWDKEAVENPEPGDGTVNYKALDKRYYFLRAQPRPGAITLVSGSHAQTAVSSFTENYYKLPFVDILQEYYLPIAQLLQKAQLVMADFWLQDTDVINFDFSKLYYIEQLSGYFIMNKINNYLPGRATKCELVRVQYALAPQNREQLFISSATGTGLAVQVYYTATKDAGYIAIEYSTNGIAWTGITAASMATGANHYMVEANVPTPGTYYLRLYQGNTGITTAYTTVTVG